MHNTETLKPETMSYLNVFYKTPDKKAYRKYNTDAFTGEKFQIKDVQYHPEADKFILVEEHLAINPESEKSSITS